MVRLMAWAAVLAATFQSGQEEEQPKFPPFKVVILAKTKGTPDRGMLAFEEGLKVLKGYATLISRVPLLDDPEDGWEYWTWHIAGEKKFDPTPLWRAFINVKVRTYVLTVRGTLSQEAQTKKLFITSYSGKTKVKLMNRPKDVFDDPAKKVDDVVGRLSEQFSRGKLHFDVTGEIFSSGGTLAILLKYFHKAAPPPTPPEPKDDKK